MIILYTIPSLWELPSFSAPCMKLETWLRMAQLSYQKVTELGQVQPPKGKFPFIDYEGKLIGDSTLIIEMFKREKDIDLDQGLSPSERGSSLAFRRMLQTNTYWGIAQIRYRDESNWQSYRQVFANLLVPSGSKEQWEPIVEGIRSKYLAYMDAQGIARHSEEEIFLIVSADFQALSDFLADKPFFMGTQPTTLDATAYAYIGNVIKPPFKSPIVDYVRRLENLCQHYERMTRAFFSEDLDGSQTK